MSWSSPGGGVAEPGPSGSRTGDRGQDEGVRRAFLSSHGHRGQVPRDSEGHVSLDREQVWGAPP